MTRFTMPQGRFGCRVAGIAKHQQHVLLQGEPQSAIWTPPGGGVDVLEPTQTALEREMREELSAEVHIKRLLWITEEFFVISQVPHHQVGFYYLMTFVQRPDLYDVQRVFHANEGDLPILCRWFSLGSLDQITLYPTFLRQSLVALPSSPAHLTLVDDDARPFMASR